MKKYTLKNKIFKNIENTIIHHRQKAYINKLFRFSQNLDLLGVYNKNSEWILKNTVPNKGIRPKVDFKNTYDTIAYPEVSGYYIPTLLNWGYRDLAIQYAKWLLEIQHEDGAWYDWLDKEPYIFDSGQILKGLIAIYPIMPEVKDAVLRGSDYIVSCIEESGRLPSPSTGFWDKNITELIHLYCLSPLVDAAKLFDKPEYETAAKKVLEYYKNNSMDKLLDFHTLSHFYAYMMEALVDMGETEIAAKAMEKIAALQRKDGHIPAYKDVKWTCSTGLFQFAIVWYKLGEKEKADLTFDYACSLQTQNGGWLGSYGKDCTYIPNEEIAWANKYFMDALRLKISTHFAKTADKNIPTQGGVYPLSDFINENDGRVQLILKSIKETSSQNPKIVDVGCGLGRILKVIQKQMPDVEIYATDIAPDIINKLPTGITARLGSLLQIPYDNEEFDFTMTTEALEHAVDIENAVSELARVTKEGGSVLIIDKDVEKKGVFEMPPWEQWFDKNGLKQLMENKGLKTKIIENIPHNDKDGSDGIYVGWLGEKI